MNACCENFNKIEFLHALKTTRQKAFSLQAIAKSFRRAGIHPFNLSTVLDRIGVETSSETRDIASTNNTPSHSQPIINAHGCKGAQKISRRCSSG
jgi:hypothetical protein